MIFDELSTFQTIIKVLKFCKSVIFLAECTPLIGIDPHSFPMNFVEKCLILSATPVDLNSFKSVKLLEKWLSLALEFIHRCLLSNFHTKMSRFYPVCIDFWPFSCLNSARLLYLESRETICTVLRSLTFIAALRKSELATCA